jgi:hypothetical protein
MEDVKRYGVIEALQKAKMTNKEADSFAFYTIPTGGNMPRGKKIAITLTKEQQKTLSMWATAGKTEQRYAQRAKAILFFSRGAPAI